MNFLTRSGITSAPFTKGPTTGNKRFLVVTHNKITMSYMNKIFGVTMMEPGISKLVSVNIDNAEEVYAAE